MSPVGIKAWQTEGMEASGLVTATSAPPRSESDDAYLGATQTNES